MLDRVSCPRGLKLADVLVTKVFYAVGAGEGARFLSRLLMPMIHAIVVPDRPIGLIIRHHGLFSSLNDEKLMGEVFKTLTAAVTRPKLAASWPCSLASD